MSQEPIRIGLAGLGRAGWAMHCSELEGRKDKFTIVAACDPIKERRERMAERYPGCVTTADFGEIVANPDVELVDIAVRQGEHYAYAAQALRAGKNVFLEKPMTVDYREARRLQQLAGRSKGNLYIRHNRRFEPGFNHIREIIAAGTLGNVYEIKLCRGGYQRRDDWQTIMDCHGGQLLNWGPHIIDHALRFVDGKVADVWSDLKKVAAVGDAEDHLKIVIRGENGLVVDLEISGGRALPEPEYIVLGTRGSLKLQGNEITMRYLDPAGKLARRRAKKGTPPVGGFGSKDELAWIEQTIPVAPATPVAMDDIWDHLYAAIRKGKTFPISLDEAVQVMEIITRVKRGTPFAD